MSRWLAEVPEPGGGSFHCKRVPVSGIHCKLKPVARLGRAGSRHFLGSRLGFWLEGSLCLGPSARETSRDVRLKRTPHRYHSTHAHTHACLRQTLCNQGDFSRLVDTTAHLTVVRSVRGDWFRRTCWRKGTRSAVMSSHRSRRGSLMPKVW